MNLGILCSGITQILTLEIQCMLYFRIQCALRISVDIFEYVVPTTGNIFYVVK